MQKIYLITINNELGLKEKKIFFNKNDADQYYLDNIYNFAKENLGYKGPKSLNDLKELGEVPNNYDENADNVKLINAWLDPDLIKFNIYFEEMSQELNETGLQPISTIRDIWNYFENCKTVEQVINNLDRFPSCFGTFSITDLTVDDTDVNITIVNTYWDDQCQEEGTDFNTITISLEPTYQVWKMFYDKDENCIGDGGLLFESKNLQEAIDFCKEIKYNKSDFEKDCKSDKNIGIVYAEVETVITNYEDIDIDSNNDYIQSQLEDLGEVNVETQYCSLLYNQN